MRSRDDVDRRGFLRASVGELLGIVEELGPAIDRNYQRWPSLGVYVWPNYFVGNTYEEEENFLTSWSRSRLLWMNSKWGNDCTTLSARENGIFQQPGKIRVFPNPSDLSNTYVALSTGNLQPLEVSLYDLNGRQVFRGNLDFAGGELAFRLPDLSHLPSGIYTLVAGKGANTVLRCKLVRQ